MSVAPFQPGPGSMGSWGGSSPVPSWISAFLQSIGAPITQANVDFLEGWQANEGSGVLGANNPLAISGTPGWGGANGWWNNLGNGTGVLTFPSIGAGIAGTIKFLQNGYSSVIDALRSGNPAAYAQSNPQLGQQIGSGWSYGLQGILKTTGLGQLGNMSPGQAMGAAGPLGLAVQGALGGSSFFGEPFYVIGATLVGIALLAIGVVWLAGYEVTSSGVARAAVRNAPGGGAISSALEAIR